MARIGRHSPRSRIYSVDDDPGPGARIRILETALHTTLEKLGRDTPIDFQNALKAAKEKLDNA